MREEWLMKIERTEIHKNMNDEGGKFSSFFYGNEEELSEDMKKRMKEEQELVESKLRIKSRGKNEHITLSE